MNVGPTRDAIEKLRNMAALMNRADLVAKLNSEVFISDLARLKTDKQYVSPPYRGRVADREQVPAYNIVNPIVTGLRQNKTNPQRLNVPRPGGRRTAGGGGVMGYSSVGAHIT